MHCGASSDTLLCYATAGITSMPCTLSRPELRCIMRCRAPKAPLAHMQIAQAPASSGSPKPARKSPNSAPS